MTLFLQKHASSQEEGIDANQINKTYVDLLSCNHDLLSTFMQKLVSDCSAQNIAVFSHLHSANHPDSEFICQVGLNFNTKSVYIE